MPDLVVSSLGNPSSADNAYCTRAELKAFAFPTLTDASRDNEIDLARSSVSRWIDSHCERRFWKDSTDTVRTYIPCALYELEIDDVVSVTALKTDAAGDGTFKTTWAANTDFQLHPLNPLSGPEQKPYRKIQAVGPKTFPYLIGFGMRRDLVQVTGIFGWPAVPDAVKQACLIQSARVYQRWKSAEGVFGGFDDVGLVRVGTKLDPDVAALLAPYRLFPVMVG